MTADDYPCHPLAYYTTRKVILALNLPLYYGRIYLPHLPFLPLFFAWLCLGVAAIVIFGGVAMLFNKQDELQRIWFK